MSQPTQMPSATSRPGPLGGRLASGLRDLASRQASVDETLQAAVDLCVELIDGCAVADVMFLRSKQSTVPVASDALSRALAQAQQQADGGPCMTAALGHEQIVVANDLRADQRWPDFARQAIELGVTSVVSYQLFLHRDDNDRFGALNLYGSGPDAFDERAIEIGEVFAAHCTAALAAAIAQEGAEAALETRDLIGQAKGILMERHRLTAEDAFERLSKTSQDRNLKLRQIAQVVTSTGELPT